MRKGWRETPFGKIPLDWDLKPISEVTSLVTDYVANGSFASLAENVKYKTEEDVAVLIRLADYNNNFAGDFVFIDEHAYEFLSKSKLYGNEIIISNVGANVGTVFRCPKLKYKMSLAPNSIMVKFKGVDDFYYYWLKSRMGQHMLHSIITGSAQPKFNKTNFRDILVPVPPVEKQERIATILKSFDDKIENNQRMNETLEGMAQALFKSWFVDFDPVLDNALAAGNPIPKEFARRARLRKSTASTRKPLPPEIRSLFPSEFQPTEHGPIPKGWKIGILSDLISVKYGKDHKKLADGSKYPVFGSGGVMRYVDSFLYDKESVLVPRKGTLNNVIYVNYPFWSVDTMFFTEMRKENIAKFVYYFLKSRDLLSMNAGSAVPSMTSNILNALDVVIPSDSCFACFENRINPMFQMMQSNVSQTSILVKARDSLLPKLLLGEIEI